MKIGCSSSSSSPLLAVVSCSGSSVSWLIYAKHLFLINHSPLLTIFQKISSLRARPVSRILGIIGVKDVIFCHNDMFWVYESFNLFFFWWSDCNKKRIFAFDLFLFLQDLKTSGSLGSRILPASQRWMNNLIQWWQ